MPHRTKRRSSPCLLADPGLCEIWCSATSCKPRQLRLVERNATTVPSRQPITVRGTWRRRSWRSPLLRRTSYSATQEQIPVRGPRLGRRRGVRDSAHRRSSSEQSVVLDSARRVRPHLLKGGQFVVAVQGRDGCRYPNPRPQGPHNRPPRLRIEHGRRVFRPLIKREVRCCFSATRNTG